MFRYNEVEINLYNGERLQRSAYPDWFYKAGCSDTGSRSTNLEIFLVGAIACKSSVQQLHAAM